MVNVMVKCPRCGYENNRNSTYCVNCTYMLKDPNEKPKKRFTYSYNWGNHKIIKKVAVVLFILIVLFISFSLIYTMTAPTPEDSQTIVTSNETGIKASSTPYVVVVNYNGSWAATMGDIHHLIDYSGEGKFEKRLNCVVWDYVLVDAKKTDNCDGVLTVYVYKDGKMIFNESSYDSRSIHFEINN